MKRKILYLITLALLGTAFFINVQLTTISSFDTSVNELKIEFGYLDAKAIMNPDRLCSNGDKVGQFTERICSTCNDEICRQESTSRCGN